VKKYSGLFILAAALLAAGAWWLWQRSSAPPIGKQVIVVGLEGLDGHLMKQLIAQGRLPAFERMHREGSRGTFDAPPPVSAPMAWAGMTTGLTPLEHGVLGYFQRGEGGAVEALTSQGRKAPAVWNVASYHGRRAGVVNWPSTWPAEKLHGFMVSDFWKADAEGATYPARAAKAMAEASASVSGGDAARLFLQGSPSSLSPEAAEKWRTFAALYAEAESQRKAFFALLDENEVDLAMLRLSLPAEAAMLFGGFSAPALEGLPAGDAAAMAGFWERLYEYVDSILAEAMRRSGPRSVVFAVSSHEARLGDDRPSGTVDEDAALDAEERFRKSGTLMAWGSNVLAGRIGATKQADLAPTVLSLLEVPLSLEFQGQVIGGLFADASFLSRVPEVKDYGHVERSFAAPGGAPNPEALRKRLESLHFRAPGAEDWRREEEAFLETARGMILFAQKRSDEAREAFKSAYGMEKRNPFPPYYLGVLEAQRNVTGPALEYLREALGRRPGLTLAYLETARIYRQRGEEEQFRGLLALAKARRPKRLDGYAFETFQAMSKKRYPEAEAAVREGLKHVTPASERAYLFNLLGLVLKNDEDRFLETEDMFREAARLWPEWYEPWMNLGILFASLKEHEQAVASFEEAMRREPGDTNLLNALGLSYMVLRRYHEARHCFERSLAIEPHQSEVEAFLLRLREAGA
jgi:tetratricopeptide (TPR) repeat protein